MRSRHVSQVIHRDPGAVYDLAADVDNLPRWAAGLAKGELLREGDDLVVESPMGRVTLRFTERNPYLILDHDVTLPSGVVVHNPMRVLPHPEGAEVVFTIRQFEMTDAEFDRDIEAVAADLRRLQELAEASWPEESLPEQTLPEQTLPESAEQGPRETLPEQTAPQQSRPESRPPEN
ncbi:Polyketide cyclase / dehydrase and lipid transport [Raineyella antarctica]|uniref:Polyketide cyclase / dehydrase and lipid transport n=1 Tax=Raineyella antarctica TaxID=1577474 RepID=A0A1G6GEM0_9ACTN|nr:SRPBCC family protein [Raineyella antarctica]SDB80427.1 Polyketide cyclase / dehydrase and lipid transport [Raineyella antarctica]